VALNVVFVRTFGEADCDADNYLLVAKVRQKLSVSKREALKIDMERFTLRKLHSMEVKEECQVKISISFAASECLDDYYVDISRAWESIRKTIKVSASDNLAIMS
jgi:hypothetical protein